MANASKYGFLEADGTEYVITNPFTPRPWVNYLTNGDYCALCSHMGGGFSFYKDHRYNSVLRRGQQQHIEDLPGRLIYIKDEDTGEIWNVNVAPIGKYDQFEARHGMGHTEISSAYAQISSDIRFFVPPEINAELWNLSIANESNRTRHLSVYSFADFVLGNVSLEDHEGCFMALFNDVELRHSSMVFHKKWWHPHHGWSEENGIWGLNVFMTTTVKPDALMANREAFFGPFRGYANPVALESEFLPEAYNEGKALVGVMQWRIEVTPGERWETQLAIGVHPDGDSAADAVVSALGMTDTYEDAWTKTQQHWDQLTSTITVHTGDAEIDSLANYWNKKQAYVNFYHGRGPSYYHKGQYQGMRDSCQDAYGVIALNPELAKENLRRIAGFFFSDGRSCGACNRIGLPEGPADKADMPLWLVLAVSDYLRETGDFDLLDERFPLMDGGESTLYQKLLAGIDRMIEERGPHGLPLIGKGDWNDAANAIGAGGKGESVWLGQFLYYVIGEMTPIMKRRGDLEKLASYAKRAEAIREIVNESCWDGEWFVRAFKDDGTPVGVKGQNEGFIWINSQTWAVISGISTQERLDKCMTSAEKYMGTEYGMMNLAPAFQTIDPSIGIITRFLHGWKENAAVFSHASSFNIVARAMLGRGADAVDLYKRLLPSNKDQDIYLVEPYVFSQFVVGPSCPEEHGRGAFHWLTGTAAWMLRALYDFIIGVHPEFDGLRIRPAVDPSWKEFSIRRRFRGSEYLVEFSNPDGVETGVRSLTLDGVAIEGDLLPLPTKPHHHVLVVMGSSHSTAEAHR